MMRWAAALVGGFVGLAAMPQEVRAGAVETSIRPQARATAPAVTAGARPEARPATRSTAEVPVRAAAAADNPGFERWLRDFRGRALAQGISARVFDEATRGIRYDASIVARDRNQSEFTRPIWEYLASAVSDSRVRNGREALARHRDTLRRIEQRYGVEAEVVVAVWGLESAYGTNRGSTRIIEAMATLAFDGRRARFFEEQLVAALKIIQSGDIPASRMLGSWAGAMGHTQFIPTSYLAYAQDFTGDGRRDIWSDDPTDALASTANYLARFGWTRGQPWGMEVRLPRGFDYAQSGKRLRMPVSEWNRMGVRRVDGTPVPDHGRASILLPAGARGAAFIIFDNFHVITRYNTADAYVIAVGHLADRIAGGGPLAASWPTGDRNLTFAERREMQERLTRRGFSTGGVDGIVGPNTIAAVRRFQASQGMVPDGYASFEILRRLR